MSLPTKSNVPRKSRPPFIMAARSAQIIEGEPAVSEDVFGRNAQRIRQIGGAFIAAHRHDDGIGPDVVEHLNAHCPDPARAARDEGGFALFKTRLHHDAFIGCERHQWNGRRLCERKIRRALSPQTPIGTQTNSA